MSTDRDTTRIVRSWLEEGVTTLPDRVLDAVLDQVPATPQRRAGWLARRLPAMSAYMRYGLTAVAIVGVVLLGFAVFRPNVGTEPSPTPIASPSTSAAPSATEHVSDFAFGLPLTFNVPAGWQVGNGPGGKWVYLREGLRLTEIGFYRVDNLYADACQPTLGGWRNPPLGPTTDDLVTALTDLPTYAEASLSATEVDGYAAIHLELAGAPSTLPYACGADYGALGPAARDSVVGLLALGQYPDVWVVDVAGQRLLIVRYGNPGRFEELDAILASLRIGT